MFDTLLLDLHSVLDRARILIKDYEQKLSEINSATVCLIKDREAFEARVQEINTRERDVKHIESVDQYHKDAKALMDSANLRQKATLDAENSYKAYVAEQNSKLSEQAAVIKKQADAVLVQRKNIEDEVSKRVAACLKTMGIKKQEEAQEV